MHAQRRNSKSEEPRRRHRKRLKMNSVPEGWLGCPATGSGFVADTFFVFKTPLNELINSNVPSDHRFYVSDVFAEFKKRTNFHMCLWVDLTNTTRYYDPNVVMDRYHTPYEKFRCEGHGKPPSKKAVADFCTMVRESLKWGHGRYVGVHCTHGINRTGFLICSYLMRERGYTATEAVTEFARNRAPGIYRQSYVDALFTMRLPLESPVIKVTHPDWLDERECSKLRVSEATGMTLSEIERRERRQSGASQNGSIEESGVVTEISNEGPSSSSGIKLIAEPATFDLDNPEGLGSSGSIATGT